MLYTIVSIDDVLNQNLCVKCDERERSSNPFDYIRSGYFIDNAALFGGSNNVSFKCNIPGNSACSRVDFANK